MEYRKQAPAGRVGKKLPQTIARQQAQTGARRRRTVGDRSPEEKQRTVDRCLIELLEYLENLAVPIKLIK